VSEWPVPTNIREVRAFIGLASYYRRFVQDFATIAAPLHALTKGNQRLSWGEKEQEAFENLKAALTSPPILAMPRDTGEFILDTDASDVIIGAVLSQCQDGVEGVVAYTSRSLDAREKNCCATRKELLAVVHFVRYFKQYLLGRTFCVRTDHAALTWLRHTSDPVGQLARWLEQLEEYNFSMEHRSGTKHANADALSDVLALRSSVCAMTGRKLLSAGRPISRLQKYSRWQQFSVIHSENQVSMYSRVQQLNLMVVYRKNLVTGPPSLGRWTHFVKHSAVTQI